MADHQNPNKISFFGCLGGDRTGSLIFLIPGSPPCVFFCLHLCLDSQSLRLSSSPIDKRIFREASSFDELIFIRC
ncbi:Molybdenum cofactor biosynthesis proteins protein [Dioscorea alata]|uniref:Molybdenum cofactor biosynthesis proteins protein n=1 Tax=Dioscorea alata TaxID=55571 RepID=A0ACB7UWH5_DIOAL|nr:Molybdenum cofactor biosynthesis proteins protein [Dioscorea alata]